MNKIKMDSGAAFLYPMPMVLVGSVVGGKANLHGGGLGFKGEFQTPFIRGRLGPTPYQRRHRRK